MANYTCEICGTKHPSVRELNTHLLEHIKTKIENKRIEEISTNLQKKRDEVEIARLDKELKNINVDAPNKEADYFQKLLDLQQKNFDKMLEVNKEQNALKLEIEKLQLGYEEDDGFMPIIEMLAPYLPQILNKGTSEAPGAPIYTQPGQNITEVKKLTKEEQLAVYVEKIKKGEITEEQAYKIFLENPDVPKIYKKASKKRFHQEFMKIKNGN